MFSQIKPKISFFHSTINKTRTKRSKRPKFDLLPTTVVWLFVFLGISIVVLTISISGLMFGVKIRFERLASTISKITSKEEADREFANLEQMTHRYRELIDSKKIEVASESTRAKQIAQDFMSFWNRLEPLKVKMMVLQSEMKKIIIFLGLNQNVSSTPSSDQVTV